MTTMSVKEAAADGCYDAQRAAALAGVPKSTVYYWARKGIVEPSVSPVQEKLWSFSDLIALRLVSWLRHPKSGGTTGDLPPNPMTKVRRALDLVTELVSDPWQRGASPIRVDRAGEIFVVDEVGSAYRLNRQPTVLPLDTLDLIGEVDDEGVNGPNLLRPRPSLRIIPAKVTGEIHIQDSRITTPAIAALGRRGYSIQVIADMYGQPPEAISEAIEVEAQLAAAA